MNSDQKSPPIIPAVGVTIAALLDLGAGLLSIANLTPASQTTQMPITAGLICSILALIGLGVLQWVVYFRGYVDFRIDQLRQEQHRSVSHPQPTSVPESD